MPPHAEHHMQSSWVHQHPCLLLLLILLLPPSSSLVLLFHHPYYHCHVCYFSPLSLAFLHPCEQLPVRAVGSLVMMVVMMVTQHWISRIKFESRSEIQYGKWQSKMELKLGFSLKWATEAHFHTSFNFWLNFGLIFNLKWMKIGMNIGRKSLLWASLMIF